MDILETCTGLARTVLPSTDGLCTVQDAALYLAHTEQGASIRALAEATGTHPSTVLRAVRRVEGMRDDPLFDGLMARLGAGIAAAVKAPPEAANANEPPGPDSLAAAARRFLRRLSEPGAFLLIAPEAEKGGIFCAANGHRKPIALMPVEIAVAFVKHDWIRTAHQGAQTTRYTITEPGRAALRRFLAIRAEARRADGLGEGQTPFQAQHRIEGARVFLDPATGREVTRAVNLGESPLGWLARRKGPDGQPFLTPAEVEAGERLRTDFETAEIGPSVAQDWRNFLTPGDRLSGSSPRRDPAEGPTAARERVGAALSALGPGLSDMALRVCCFLEGLEACERRMGWAARSGKVVLKIALQRLVLHYGLERTGH